MIIASIAMKTAKKLRAIAFDIIKAHGQTGTVAQFRRPVYEKTDTVGEIQMSLIVWWGIKSGAHSIKSRIIIW